MKTILFSIVLFVLALYGISIQADWRSQCEYAGGRYHAPNCYADSELIMRQGEAQH